MYKISKDLPQLDREGFHFRLDYCDPSEFAKSVAEKELRETPENIEAGLKELRSLLKAETNLHCPMDNDLWLLSFLRPAHFYPEGALEKIKNYYNYRRKYPELCKNLQLSTVKKVLHDYNGSTLPQRDQYGRRLYTVLLGKYWNIKKFTREALLQSFIAQCDFVRSEPETQINGIVVVVDVEGMTMQQVFQLTPSYAKRLIQAIEVGIGIRLKGYHIVNNPKIFDIAFAIIKRFTSEKIINRVHLHGTDMSSLHRFISPDCLPECYGGTLKSAKQSYGPEFYEVFEKYESDFDQYQEYGFK
ncbi:alpha-tocopherol transfer protein-like [Musca autumnalis]|uniref:alpha-tocopherol transfer protein-like n=1 Tax=Musca autumnalis TaxID=221902 RepID=UPI003CEFBF42